MPDAEITHYVIENVDPMDDEAIERYREWALAMVHDEDGAAGARYVALNGLQLVQRIYDLRVALEEIAAPDRDGDYNATDLRDIARKSLTLRGDA